MEQCNSLLPTWDGTALLKKEFIGDEIKQHQQHIDNRYQVELHGFNAVQITHMLSSGSFAELKYRNTYELSQPGCVKFIVYSLPFTSKEWIMVVAIKSKLIGIISYSDKEDDNYK